MLDNELNVTVGNGLTVTTVADDVDVHPALPTVTVYELAALAVIDWVVAPVDHKLFDADEDVKTTFPPAQKVVAPPELILGVVGIALIVTFWFEELVPPFIVKDIVFVPAVEYVTECGPAPVAVAGVAPAPKFQFQEVALNDASVNVTVCEVHAAVSYTHLTLPTKRIV